jgi:hypothetical protein
MEVLLRMLGMKTWRLFILSKVVRNTVVSVLHYQ